jgi:hypothetical protein
MLDRLLAFADRLLERIALEVPDRAKCKWDKRLAQ